MKKSIEELKHNLELAKKSISKKCVIEDNILFVSLRNKINELESEIKHYDHAPKRDVAVTHKPLAVKKDILVKHVEPKHAPSKPIVHEKKVVKKEVPARSANLPTASSNKEINKILDMEVARHQKHYRLFKLGIPLDEIVELTGATRSNIGRDILQYKKGVLKLS